MEKLLLTEADIQHHNEFAVFAVSKSADEWHRSCLERLYKKWNAWNRDFFSSRMVQPYIMLSDMAGAKTMGDYSRISGFGGKSQIRIRDTILLGTYPLTTKGNRDPEGLMRVAEDVLLHVMVHQFAHECVGMKEESYHGHGPFFSEQCNRIGTYLDIGPVRKSKKRGPDAHLPSCSNWPHVVRPNSYYLGAWPTPVSEQVEFWSLFDSGDHKEIPETVSPAVLTEAEWLALMSESPKLNGLAASALKKLATIHKAPLAA